MRAIYPVRRQLAIAFPRHALLDAGRVGTVYNVDSKLHRALHFVKSDPPKILLVSVPRETLAELLAKAGYPDETPESFLSRGRVGAEVQKGNLLQKAAKVARWSRIWLLISAIASLPFIFGSLDLEGVLTLLALIAMTVVEFRVHQGLVAGNAASLRTGWMNQCAFAMFFFIYGIYHVFAPVPPVSPELMDLLGSSSSQIVDSIMPIVIFWTRVFYAAVGLAGGIGQLLLARYYHSVFKKVELPPPLINKD